MAKSSFRNKNKGSKLKFVVEKLQRSLLIGGRNNNSYNKSIKYHDHETEGCVPEDVKEGHFAVIADAEGEGPKRFVMPLSCLNNPTFLRLLEQAEQEYGFDHGGGALTIPCRPSVIQTILLQQQHWQQDGGSHETSAEFSSWSSCDESMVLQSY